MVTIAEQKKSLIKWVSELALWKRVIAAVVLIALLCGLGSVLSVSNRASISLTVAFARGSEGHNPDGSAFQISQIISDEVLAAAAKKLGDEMDVETLRAHLSVTDATPRQTLDQIKQNIRQGVTDYTGFPTTYQLTYATVSPAVQAQGIWAVCAAIVKQVTLPGKKQILDAVAQSYADHYQQTYLQHGSVFDVKWDEIDLLDHYDRIQAVRLAMERAERFLQAEYDVDVGYADQKDGMGYGDMQYAFQQLLGVDVDNYEAFVLQHGLTRDRQTLLRELRYLENQRREDYQRSTSEYEVYMEAITMYDADTTKVVFIPSLDAEDSFYMNRTKVGMDYLVERANDAKLAADEAQHDVAHYAYLRECFSNVSEPVPALLGQGDELYSEIKEKAAPMLKQAAALLKEDVQNDQKGVKLGQVDFGFYPIPMAMSCVKPFIFLSLSVFLLWCGWGVLAEKKRNKKQEGNDHVGA